MSNADPAPRALRLELALLSGLVLPDSGPIAVFHPRAGEWFDPLPRDRVKIITPHAPDHSAFSAQGYPCAQAAEGRYAAALICLPRGRAEARDLIAQACAVTDGPVIIDGQKHDGADAILREIRARADLSEAIAKGHGKIAWFRAPADAFADWRAEPGQCTDADGNLFRTMPGVFSADGIDPASELLAAALPGGLKGVAADLGAGWGYLATQLLARAPGLTTLHLIESDARALDCARHNVTDPRARFHWADATQPLPRLAFDAVIMNPPFHTSREARPQLGAAFIKAAAQMLKPSGQLWLVANRHLPYETTLDATFRKITELPGAPGFKLFHAEGPKKQGPAIGRPRPHHHSGRRA
ncbi:MAG: class I SAM-dependent methyltransferase [Rhodobacteraceae bacterium]|jgi:16S rRNA (guanine1207-N2)-methyltransferase|nr:class I SAM-dependent methyltransferase [Paracoccaceae bacterium]